MKFKLILIGLVLVSSLVLRADDDDDEGGGEHEGREKKSWLSKIGFKTESEAKMQASRKIPNVSNSKWQAECSSCHMLYQPGLLPERSWIKMMNGLENHFGENASLDDSAKKEVLDFLVLNSSDRGGSRRGMKILNSIPRNDAPLRISETQYFIRKHNEIRPDVYKRKAIGSAANCIACHSGAEKGDFEEENVRIPKASDLAPTKANSGGAKTSGAGK